MTQWIRPSLQADVGRERLTRVIVHCRSVVQQPLPLQEACTPFPSLHPLRSPSYVSHLPRYL